MRIISGKARGRKLAEFSGTGIRPTPDRVREALFSLLFSRLGSFADLKVLDLCAGSGALSLEAISRHASSALMIDSGSDAIELMRENIKRCKFEQETEVSRQDVTRVLPSLTGRAPFDLIFLDPPYKRGMVPGLISEIDRLNLLSDDGIICAETESGETITGSGNLQCIESRRYGSTTVHLLRRRESTEE
ncbi:MAG TPA: 16S rRNA (guanine(966)-N(2))-methyltransferase RsmD [Geopsychrobacteraceae bacterium]|nr:16S rRNA (guanine(966)-N(2))-methyltransferase RsmD [Geopsychrobacteraceae bacterium]